MTRYGEYLAHHSEPGPHPYNDLFTLPHLTQRSAGLNYPDSDLKDWAFLYYLEGYPRLQQAKKLWDPHDKFNHDQSIKLPE